MRGLVPLLVLLSLHLACDRAPPQSEPPRAASASPAAAPPASVAPKSTCPAGWIDECGDCYQPCNADRDCTIKGKTCQPIVCAHTSYGSGCASP